MKFYSVTIQMKATEQYFPVVLFIMQYKVCWGKFFSFCFSFSHLLVIVYFSFRSGISLITLLCYVLYVNFVIVCYLAPLFLYQFTCLLV